MDLIFIIIFSTSSPLGREIVCSLYMRELQGFILRSVNTFLAPYKNQTIVAEW